MDSIVCLDMSAFITLQTIKKGEQLFISYGQEFHHMPTPKRREELQNIRSYWCDCPACINNWNPGHDFPSAYYILPKKIAPKMSMTFMECTIQITKQNFFNHDTTSPEEIKKLMSGIFKMINLIGRYNIYPCEEISQGKALLYCIIKWIAGYQSPIDP
ncbi:uncharacterized protein LOC123271584 [Cotesia glomerata]|uniref:uncharacterized protein LOC123271584 n=1 Tax=Cotesia glomerata TaxID=32391 RepID=UPI001D035CDA|nr:uncharacterized protein LOC123271584 [Cotesia glomerata]